MWSPFICMFATQFFLELISLQGSFDSFLELSPHQVVTIEVQTRSQFSETDSVRVRLSEHISLVSRPAGGDLPAKYHRSPAQAWNQQFLELSSTLLPIFPTNPQCVWWHVSSNQPISISPSLWDGADDKADGAGGTDYWELEIISLFCTQRHPSLNRQLLTMRQFKVMPHILGSLFHLARMSHLFLQSPDFDPSNVSDWIGWRGWCGGKRNLLAGNSEFRCYV